MIELGINEHAKKFITQSSLKNLSRRFPGIFDLKQIRQANGQRPLCIEFMDIESQDKADMWK